MDNAVFCFPFLDGTQGTVYVIGVSPLQVLDSTLAATCSACLRASALATIAAYSWIESPRLAKTEQVSRNRFHHVVKLKLPEAVDAELLRWLNDAYKLSR